MKNKPSLPIEETFMMIKQVKEQYIKLYDEGLHKVVAVPKNELKLVKQECKVIS